MRVRLPERVVPVVVAAFAAAAVVLAIEPWPVGVFQDDGIYVVLARALATGEGYRYTQMPGAPAATHYPPGFPFFLAALWKLAPSFPGNVALFKYANAVLVGLAAVLTWALARRYAGLAPSGASATALLFTACSPVVLLGVMVLSEPLFMVGAILALMAGERAARSGDLRDAALAGVAAAALAMVRTLGILVVPAVAVALLMRRQWRAALVLGVVAGLGLLPWQLWVGAHAREVPPVLVGKYGSYFAWLGGAWRDGGVPWVLDVVRHNLGQLAFESWTHTGTVLGPGWLRALATVTLALVLGAGLVVAWSRVRVVALFVAAYLAVVLAWPFAPARFLWGIWPVIGVVCILGLQGLAGTGQGRAAPGRRRAAGALAVALLVGYLKFNVESARERWWSQVQGSVATRARPLVEWAMANTDTSVVLATDDDLLIHLYTGRRTVPNVTFTPHEHLLPQAPALAVRSLREILEAYDVGYVLAVSDYGRQAANGLLGGERPGLRQVASFARGAAFKVVPAGEAIVP